MPKRFYFAWADSTETTFGPEHHVEDESVFSLTLTHAEGDFPTVDLEIINPREGMLNLARKQWVWVSCVTDTDEVKPICFGRLIGVPSDIVENICKITLVCRPKDFLAQKAELASSLKVLPYYDRLFVPYEKHHESDNVLEAYSRLWHCDRYSSTVTASDIVSGEDGTVVLDRGKVFYDSLRIEKTSTPISAVKVKAKVDWGQVGEGTIDITKPILDAFAAGTLTYPVEDINGNTFGNYKMPLLMGASGMADAWPKTGTDMRGGWQVASSSLQYVGQRADGDILIGPAGISELTPEDASGVFKGRGVVVQQYKGPDESQWDYNEGTGSYQEGTDTIIWIPIIPVAPHLEIAYGANRSRSETISFTLVSDIQPLCYEFQISDIDEASIATIDFGSAKADDARDPPEGSDTETTDYNTQPIEDTRRKTYFQTDRGMQSIQYLMLRARANLLSSARAVDVSVSQDFDEGLDLSLRKNASLTDGRIPGSTAIGKITKYVLSYDGNDGCGTCDITFSCTVGEGSSVGTPNAGEETYVEEGYESGEFIVRQWQEEVIATSDIKWDISTVTAQLLDDDGVELQGLDASDAVSSCTITGGLESQNSSVQTGCTGYHKELQFGSRQPRLVPEYEDTETIKATIGSIKTTITMQLRNLVDKEFSTEFSIGDVTMVVPKGINLA